MAALALCSLACISPGRASHGDVPMGVHLFHVLCLSRPHLVEMRLVVTEHWPCLCRAHLLPGRACPGQKEEVKPTQKHSHLICWRGVGLGWGLALSLTLGTRLFSQTLVVIFFVVFGFWGGGTTPSYELRNYSCLGLGDLIRCGGLNLDQLRATRVFSLLCAP